MVARYDATPDAANYVDKNYSPTGKIQFPVITLHTDQDPLVPEFHEAIYADTVGQAGKTRAYRRRLLDMDAQVVFSMKFSPV